ncbi:hypothetical protein [Pseudomonas parafulva]|uniref:Lysozyme n=1 Tax=Pseudomonas parafulva TaxID=157782 RepID=A0ABN4XT40_9PSED|nr:hypothetical protein [Pseudomonas parafulva]AQW68362.1 hypothetical protein B2J77_09120 [Pseudomonas parafulva]
MNIVTTPIKSADENICGAEFSVVNNASGSDYGSASQRLTFNAFSDGANGSSASGVFAFNADAVNATIQIDYALSAVFSVYEFKQAVIEKPDPESGETSSEIVYEDNAQVHLMVLRQGQLIFNKRYTLKTEGEDGKLINTSEPGIYFGGGFSINMPIVMGAPYLATLHSLDARSAVIRISASRTSVNASVRLTFPLENKSTNFTTRETKAIDAALRHNEGNTDFMYLDDRGFVTVGVGFMLPNEQAALAYPFFDLDDNPASDEQKRSEWRTIHSLPSGYLPSWYSEHGDLYLESEFIDSKVAELIDDSFMALSRIFPDVGQLPSAARIALQDMVYNLGEEGLRRYTNLRAAIARRDWQTAAAESHRIGPNDERNNATRDLFLEAGRGGDF